MLYTLEIQKQRNKTLLLVKAYKKIYPIAEHRVEPFFVPLPNATCKFANPSSIKIISFIDFLNYCNFRAFD